ncbi:MAG: chemotaxis-specific protein-glutamate methyltransferase CheB [Thermodesulfobacteriota bacterium]
MKPAEVLRALVIDESVVNRRALSEALTGWDGVEMVGVAATAAIARAKLDKEPVDLVLLDADMDGADPLETLAWIKARQPETWVIMLSDLSPASAEKTVKALSLGALEALAKPGLGPDYGDLGELSDRLGPVLRTLLGKKHIRRAQALTRGRPAEDDRVLTHRPEPPSRPEPQARPPVRPAPAGPVEVIALGVSTGGPAALAEVIPRLPGDLGVPVLIVQHMPPGFTAALAEDLNRKSTLRVLEAKPGLEVLPNTVYLAPGGRHMLVHAFGRGPRGPKRLVLDLSDAPPVNSCRPAADVLFHSLARACDGHILAVIMTGLGSDGAAGVRLMKEKGCYCLSQTEKTCVVYSMPRAVVEAGLADEQAPLDRLAGRIIELVRGGPGKAAAE